MRLNDFLELYMTSYTSDSRITKIDQISKVLNREAHQCDCDLLDHEDYHNLHNLKDELTDECFQEAFKNYKNR